MAGLWDILNFTGFHLYFKCTGLKAAAYSTTGLMSTKYFEIIASIKSVITNIQKKTADQAKSFKGLWKWTFWKTSMSLDFLKKKGLFLNHLDFKKIGSCKIKDNSVSH